MTELELTTFDEQAYWTTRGYAEQAPIKTSSRIDTPKPLAKLAAGPVAIPGVAWAQGTGIAAVEVSIDEGPLAASPTGRRGRCRHLAPAGRRPTS